MTTITSVMAQFPCHPGRKVRLNVLSRRYDRTCPECGAVYIIDRETIKDTPGMRVDTATWERVSWARTR